MNNEKEKTFKTKDLYVIQIDYKGTYQIFILEAKELSLKVKTDDYQLDDTLFAYFDVFTKQFCGTSDNIHPIPISQFINTKDKKGEYTLLELKNIYKRCIQMQKKEKQKMGFDTTKVNTK
jgi:hypothetical protein